MTLAICAVVFCASLTLSLLTSKADARPRKTDPLVAIVAAASQDMMHDCAAVDVVRNVGAWISGGEAYTARYREVGSKIIWNTRVPRLLRRLVTENRGRAIRVACLS